MIEHWAVVVMIVFVVGASFGTIHCIAWVFFTSDTLGVDVANLKCHYDYSSYLCLFDYPFLFLAGRDLDNSAITVGYFPL